MKRIVLLLLLSIGVTYAYGQRGYDLDDVVYLKNGSVIRGIIIEQIPNESIKLQTYDGNIFVYTMDEIQKFTKELPYGQRLRPTNTRFSNSRIYSEFNKPTGYMGLVEIGIAPGFSYDILRLGVTMINGYRVCPQFAVGVGTGLFIYARYGELTTPFFLHLRSDFLDRRVSPFVSFNFGYNLSLLGGYYGGLMMEPTLGVSFNIGNKHRMTVGASFAVDRVKGYYYDNYDYNYGYTIRDWGFAINAKVGFSF